MLRNLRGWETRFHRHLIEILLEILIAEHMRALRKGEEQPLIEILIGLLEEDWEPFLEGLILMS